LGGLDPKNPKNACGIDFASGILWIKLNLIMNINRRPKARINGRNYFYFSGLRRLRLNGVPLDDASNTVSKSEDRSDLN
jgi:hypothetical protein